MPTGTSDFIHTGLPILINPLHPQTYSPVLTDSASGNTTLSLSSELPVSPLSSILHPSCKEIPSAPGLQHQNLALTSLPASVRVLPSSLSHTPVYYHSGSPLDSSNLRTHTVIRTISCETPQRLPCIFCAKVKCLAGSQLAPSPLWQTGNAAPFHLSPFWCRVRHLGLPQLLDPSLLLLCLTHPLSHHSPAATWLILHLLSVLRSHLVNRPSLAFLFKISIPVT